jgi:hypothetical protein
MVALMLAPAYKGLGTGDDGNFNGFRRYGTIIAAVMLVVVGGLCVAATWFANKVRTERDAEATALKKEADRKRAAAGGAAPAVAEASHVTVNPVLAAAGTGVDAPAPAPAAAADGTA